MKGPNKLLNKINQVIRTIVPFFSFQLLIQGIDGITGILIIRNLIKEDYAIYSISTSLISSIVSIAISGLGSYQISKGSINKENKKDYSIIFFEVFEFIQKSKKIIILISIPLIILIIRKSFLNPFLIAILTCTIIVDSYFRINLQIYQNTLQVYKQSILIQKILLSSAIFRFSIIGIFSLLTVNVFVALFALLLSYQLQYFLLKKVNKKYLLDIQNNTAVYQKDIKKLYFNQVGISFYYTLDTQIATFLLLFLGNYTLIADFNAGSRLSLFFVAINSFITNFLVGRFAEINSYTRFFRLYLNSLSSLILIYSLLFGLIYFFPNIFIWIIGAKYSNLGPSLYILMIVLSIGSLATFMNSVNYSKMWIANNWIAIPCTIITQIVSILTLDLSTIEGVFYFTLLCAIPSTFIYFIFNIRGMLNLKSLHHN